MIALKLSFVSVLLVSEFTVTMIATLQSRTWLTTTHCISKGGVGCTFEFANDDLC